MTVILKTGADPKNPKEQETLNAAVGVLSPGETLKVTPGTWPGNVTMPAGSSISGSGKFVSILPGKIQFDKGGSITGVGFPEGSKLIYDSGSGDFSDLVFDGDMELNGGVLTGDDVVSITGTGSATVKVGGGASVNLKDITLGPIILGGVSNLLNSSVVILAQGGGVSTVTNVAVSQVLTIGGGIMTARNVIVAKSGTLQPGGGLIIPPGGNVVIVGG